MANSFLSFAQHELEYTIVGTLPDSIDNVYVYMTPIGTSVGSADSAFVQKGNFLLKGIAKNTKELYSIWSDVHPTIGGWVVLEPGAITYRYQKEDIKGGGYAYAQGTYLNNLLADSIFIPAMQLAKFGESMMSGSLNIGDPEMSEYVNEMRNCAISIRKNILAVIDENLNNPVGEHLFLMYCQFLREEDLDKILPNLSETTRQKYDAKKGAANLPKMAVGQQYIPFSGKTPDNGTVNSADIIRNKKIILLDFWASWCAPCIKEMPILAQLYEDYKDQGLEIISISLDENKLKWRKAIEKHNMSWIQIINGKQQKDDIANLYGVSAIPHTILIDKEGKIVSFNLNGEELIDEIENLLK
ncbi:MAG: AhpC/TSA family protein [Candidatus Symbiothrix sp.]|nr:AhpC/TSA family protein [Candidatus Symbiothrix sp.]